jgi:hypothetical protein
MLSAFAEIGPHLNMAARQSKQISAALAQGQGGMTQLAQACELALQPVLASLDGAAGVAVQRVLAMIHSTVDALEQIAKPFEHETAMVSQQVERMYKGLQYQDRISQMMTLLHEDIERLQRAMSAPQADIDASAWLARLQSQYVMAEQHAHHAHTAGSASSSGDDEETTFF